jgi:RNA polymerase sigma-70 factor (ECF subfamily)
LFPPKPFRGAAVSASGREGVAGVLSDDQSLVERIRRGDSGGAEELFERYAAALLRFADRMLSDRDAAQEVTQEVFVKVISRAHQYDGRAAVSSWLFAIAANACRDRRRRDRRAAVVSLDAIADLPARAEGIEARMDLRQRRAAVRRALECLSAEQREALVLARYHGLPYSEIARVLGISVGAVKTRIFRAVETLRARFAEGEASWNAVN